MRVLCLQQDTKHCPLNWCWPKMAFVDLFLLVTPIVPYYNNWILSIKIKNLTCIFNKVWIKSPWNSICRGKFHLFIEKSVSKTVFGSYMNNAVGSKIMTGAVWTGMMLLCSDLLKMFKCQQKLTLFYTFSVQTHLSNLFNEKYIFYSTINYNS